MRLYRTKYATLTTDELLRFAEQNTDSLTELGRELLQRLEIMQDNIGRPKHVVDDKLSLS